MIWFHMLKIINMYTKILPMVYLQEAGFWVIFLFIFVLFHLYQFLYLSCSCSSNKKCYWMNIFTYICLNSYVLFIIFRLINSVMNTYRLSSITEKQILNSFLGIAEKGIPKGTFWRISNMRNILTQF